MHRDLGLIPSISITKEKEEEEKKQWGKNGRKGRREEREQQVPAQIRNHSSSKIFISSWSTHDISLGLGCHPRNWR